ncbi:MAG: hypothetical protein AB1412_02985 [Pseudomonadota bacterium]
MELTELKNRIYSSFTGSQQGLEDVIALIEQDRAIFPFNEYEHLVCTLINKGGLSYQKYIEIRTEYINENPNLWIFEISAPRGFGESFAQTYVQGKSSKLKKPSKKIDPNYAGQYDLWLDGIAIEVKASRAVDRDSDEPLYMKALSRDTQKRFLMNFQQLKPDCCDVFIWVAVYRDQIVLWIIGSGDVAKNPSYSSQHRGGIEGQVMVTNDNIHLLDQYELKDDSIEHAIRNAALRKYTS